MSDHIPTVLVVEDEESFVEALVVGLKREGFRVEVAFDGVEAIERFDAVRPDIVLLDVMMPSAEGLDGFQICQQMRREPEIKDIPVIILSAIAQGMGEMREKVKTQVGADDFFMKPYNPADLVSRVRELCRA